MDKRKLIADVARKTNYSKWEIDKLLPLVCESILTALQNGEKVSIDNFRTFNFEVIKQRVYFNPHTKTRTTLPAKVQVVFNITRKFCVDEESAPKIIRQNEEAK